MLDDIRGELIREQEKAYLVIHDQEQPKRMFTYATFLMLVHGLMCWLVDQRISLNSIGTLSKTERYSRLFGTLL